MSKRDVSLPDSGAPGDAAPADAGTRPDGKVSAEVLDFSRLVIALVHAVGLARRAVEQEARAEGEPHASAIGTVSAHAIRAAMYVYQYDSRTIGQLASGLRISYGWASRLVEELEQAGAVARERDEEDRRVVRVRLLPAAVETVSRAYRRRGEAIEKALEPLSPPEREAVRVFLSRLAENLSRGIEDENEPGETI